MLRSIGNVGWKRQNLRLRKVSDTFTEIFISSNGFLHCNDIRGQFKKIITALPVKVYICLIELYKHKQRDSRHFFNKIEGTASYLYHSSLKLS